jgi:hypothetical protein
MHNFIDTDSIIFSCPRGKNPIPEGNFLGEMSREHPECEILEVVCAGPKHYALKLRNKESGDISYSMKCRGITLDKKNEDKMSYEKFKKMVFAAYGEEEQVDNPFFEYSRIGPDKDSHMFTKQMSKVYRCVNNKGFHKDGLIYPYGF